MARQRFIWPTIWDDPDLGRLPEGAFILYVACFSNADDDGRLLGDPVYLRSLAFRYRDYTEEHVVGLRDQLEQACKSFRVYTHEGSEYIAFANWDEFQKPKYPRPSKLPAPPGFKKKTRQTAERSRKSSGNGSEHVPNASGNGSEGVPPWVGQGRVGLGLKAEPSLEDPREALVPIANSLPFSQELLVSKLISHIGSHADEGTDQVIRSYATHLPEVSLAKVLESSEKAKPQNRAAYVVGSLKDEISSFSSPLPILVPEPEEEPSSPPPFPGPPSLSDEAA